MDNVELNRLSEKLTCSAAVEVGLVGNNIFHLVRLVETTLTILAQLAQENDLPYKWVLNHESIKIYVSKMSELVNTA